MRGKKTALTALILMGALGMSAVAANAQEVLFKARLQDSGYCHLKFPAIREDTLSWDRPVLKDKSTSDIIDFYGSCDTDPLGKDQIARQRSQVQQGDS
ncbi:MAG: hypothetical protein HYV00_01695 [Deltaproteobacteria bacterium]|nr:hypothetical protein [Deltaproteobacteria bacterium]